jgi:hypothetical protein
MPAANIGKRERLKRLAAGIAMLLVAVLVYAIMLSSGINRIWRLWLFVPLFAAGVGFFQAGEKT